MNAVPIVIGSLLFVALAYRYYSAFIAAKVLALNDSRETPAYALNDGANYHPTNKWVLFGHHFAAIAGAGPLIGPVLAAQFGFAPGLLWMLLGAVIAGGVHDFLVLVASVRHKGKSLAEIARREVSPLAGAVASLAILIIIVVALSGLGLAVVNALRESAWGTFTIAMTIPIALFVGLWMNKLRPGKIGEATVIGVVAVFAAVIFGNTIAHSSLAHIFILSREGIIVALAVYGFFASVLPVWLLLAPRDYLSSYLKIGTILALLVSVFVVHPNLKMPAFTQYIHGNGPIIPGKLFPFLFITIACGAISGFHALVSSGTTPKMICKESETRMIGYGAMLVEAVVSVVALIAACSLFPADYYAINLSPAKFASLGLSPVNLAELSREVGENIAGRPGGAVSLAAGFTQILSAIPGLRGAMSYFYHFAIMFEALFILTTIDAGTRIARFCVQEFAGRVWKPMERTNWLPGAFAATFFVVFAWAFFIWTGNISNVWPMFGTANQLLAGVALAIVTVAIINAGKVRYVWVSLVPLAFVAVTTFYAGWLNIFENFLPSISAPGQRALGIVNVTLTVVIMLCSVVILVESGRRAYRVLAKGQYTVLGKRVNASDPGFKPPEFGGA
ncbi:MAG: carbon starvation protein A [Candidatus Aminicenantales bacterium]|jgi:carbon starvation protein